MNSRDAPKHKKKHYIDLSHNGFKWVGYWDGLHHFSKQKQYPLNGRWEGGYLELKCLESDIEDGSWKYLADHGYTR